MSVALCMIAHDEGEILNRALVSAKGGFDELIIAFGNCAHSATTEVAQRWNARIVTHPFTDANGIINNFAGARNAAIRATKSEYWWWMDADEIALPGTILELRCHAAAR